MIAFDYTVKDRDGIHARPAGTIIKTANLFSSDIKIEHKGRTESLKGGIFALLGMGIRCGDTLRIKVEGIDEKAAADEIKKTFEEVL
ncbi:MAG: HPr family phosphocarrier protein [Succinatimonas sp.]|nr:HPr family phosphocarrier protein [Succinatimonas sp.]